jgi:hypothetical protein
MRFIEKCGPAAKNLAFTEHSYNDSSLAGAQIHRSFQKDMPFSNNIDLLSRITLPKNMISGGVGFNPKQIGKFLKVIFSKSLKKSTAF